MIKLLQTPHPLGLNDNIYHEGNFSRLPDFDVVSLLNIRKHNKRKNRNLKRNDRYFTGLRPPVIYFTDRSKAVPLLWIFYVLFCLVLV